MPPALSHLALSHIALAALLHLTTRVHAAVFNETGCQKTITYCVPTISSSFGCRCQCKDVTTCGIIDPSPYPTMASCLSLVQRDSRCIRYCGKAHFGCTRSGQKCQCSRVVGCGNQQEFNTLAECLSTLFHYLQWATAKCPSAHETSQFSHSHQCSSMWENFCQYDKDCHFNKYCCYSRGGCNPNPFKYAPTDKCHLSLPTELLGNPCKAIRCKPGFICTQDASLCTGPCSEFRPHKAVGRLFCVIDPNHDPCKGHHCERGLACVKSLKQDCRNVPCPAKALCVLDPNFDPCKPNPCSPDELCESQPGQCQAGSLCPRRAECLSDPLASEPVILSNFSTSYDVFVNQNVTLTCEAVGHPPITSLEWNWDVGSDGISVNPSRVNDKRSLSHLVISHVTKNHTGNYTCTAKNYVGSASIRTEVIAWHECLPCRDSISVLDLCSLDLVVQARVDDVSDDVNNNYNVSVTRTLHSSTSALHATIRVETIGPIECTCQKLVVGRQYLFGLHRRRRSSEMLFELFPNGAIYPWNEVRHRIRFALNKGRLICPRY